MSSKPSRWEGYSIKLWDGPKKNFALTPEQLLARALHEALKKKAPITKLTAVLRYFVETGR